MRHEVSALAVQYTPTAGNRDANAAKIFAMLSKTDWKKPGRLIVLPEYSFTGVPATAEAARALEESLYGHTAQNLYTLANQNAAHVVGSFIEQAEGKLFVTAMLVGPDGKTLGTYRKTHLEDSEREWASAGDELAVFPTAIGRIGLLLGGDARFPEASGVLSVKRADIIAIPSAWRGQYGTHLQIFPRAFRGTLP